MPNKKNYFSHVDEYCDNWTNYDNIDFYEEVALGLLEQLAISGGLNTCCDIKLIEPLILNKKSILEVGAGYGRILHYLLEKKTTIDLYAIERGLEFSKVLKKRFGNKVHFLQADLHNLNVKKKFDVILWMWAGISDFSKLEQPLIIKKLASFLNKDGLIVIDTADISKQPLNSISIKNQEYLIRLDRTINHVYCPTPEEINEYAISAGLKTNKKLFYKTTTNRSRILNLISY